jgi:superfamily II DNA helicase RecQ
MNNQHDELVHYGHGKAFQKTDAERLFRTLVMDGILREDCQKNAGGFITMYIKVSLRFCLV